MSKRGKDLIIKTREGSTIKTLIETIENYVSQCALRFDKKTIKINEVDDDRKIYIQVELKKENFDKFTIREGCTHVVNLEHMKKIMSSIKKKNTFSLYRTFEEPDNLFIVTKDPETGKTSHGRLAIFKDSPITDIEELPDISDMNPAYIVSNSEFRRSCKAMNGNGKSVKIEGQTTGIRFSSVETLYDKIDTFGKWKEEAPVIFSTEIDTKQLVSLAKSAGLSGKLKLFCLDKAFVILTDVGNLGTLKIYLISSKHEK